MPPTPRSSLHERIGLRVRQLRQERGLTQAQLAETVGCSNHFISGIERGVDSPSLMTLEKLSESLGVTVADLVALDGNLHDVVTDNIAKLLRTINDTDVTRAVREVVSLFHTKRRR